jgi:hypothetical protein
MRREHWLYHALWLVAVALAAFCAGVLSATSAVQ